MPHLPRINHVRAALLLLLATALPARAEICRFRAGDAENPFHRWLASQEVTCVAAGSPLDFPAGLWNVFVRAEGKISASPLLIDGDAEPASVEPALAPGATIAPLLPDAHTAVIYAPRRGSAFPVDAARVTVPAGEPLWLFVLDKTKPVAVIPIPPLAEGVERTVDGRRGGPPSIIGWLRVPESDRNALETATAVSAPAVRAGSGEADPLPSVSLLHGAFVRIPEVAAGSADLRVEGRGWIPNRRAVRVQPGITVVPAPLVVRATGTLIVHWNTNQDLVALDLSVGACDESRQVPKLVIAISKCTPQQGQRPGAMDCTSMREETVDRFFGSMAFDDLVPGSYRAEMRFGKLPPTSNAASVGPVRATDLRLFATYFTVYGSVTRGGEPLGERVRIAFPGGTGFAPADTDEYRAVFRPPGAGTDTAIEVVACDGSPRAVVLADEPMRPRTRFNIDIRANELIVHVNDTFTRESLAGAMVKLELISKSRPRRVVYNVTTVAGEDGKVKWEGLPVREVHLTVSHSGYETRKLDPFTMIESGTHTVDAQLVPLRGTRGRIVSDRPFDRATVLWFSPTGSETERAELAADGTFVYTNWHTPDETMAVVSASHPLWVLPAPETERRQSLSLRFPDAPSAAFDVWLAASVPPHQTRYIGMAIGGIRVPQPALALHQTLRRAPPLLRGAGPQHFRDLLATGPIDVILGPMSEEVASRAQHMDIFAFPQFADSPRQRVEPGTTDVVF